MVGVDASADCVAECKKRYPHLAVRQMRAEDLRFDDASFDRVESSHLLEHVEDFAAALAEMARVLRPGGRLVAEVPTPALEQRLLNLDPEYQRRAGHRRVVTSGLMVEIAARNGLELKRRINVDGVLHLWVVNSFRRGRYIESEVGEIPGSSTATLKILRYFSLKIFRHRKLRWIPLWLLGIPLGCLLSQLTPLAHRYVFVKPGDE
ncbi:MAG: hypothetical protein A2Y63_02290 [Candidatus Riflebacteria bacterium RBG_13_59_9]|nr:MAG: hypothetical protein A2Y63_02290 [Candidatus Riflebacteria bacterium RBG_13_59_9]